MWWMNRRREQLLSVFPLMREFINVFSKEFHGLLLDREIEFVIDITLRTKPISITLYHMAPTELKELKI